MAAEEDYKRNEQKAYRFAVYLFSLLFILISVSMGSYMIKPSFFGFQSQPSHKGQNSSENDGAEFRNGIHLRTGLINAQGLMTVVGNCTSCHSSKIILQNRMTAESWNTTIKWMQETQNLWDLGENQEIIVNYLTTNYPIEDKGRRENLSDIDWYELEN